ncbi:MAG: T9SS type A sorting domain-containing protein [Gammaproteobacteria bacterium]|nr:T9SS type A sorting domain-containing protein [Gammaproteobacteria bacterium]NIX56035.1 T9SS type A sorting domain-containing protein [candidate division Zixibacteria bacterium]
MSENPTSGTIPAMDSLDVTVTANSSGMSPGNYQARIVINSNDPVNPEMNVPVTMQVGDFPGIAVSPDSLIFPDSVRAGQQDSLSLYIYNHGTLQLDISDITVSDTVFFTNQTSLTVQPNDSAALMVYFAPEVEGDYYGTLKLINNDPQMDTMSVYLEGHSYPPVGIAGEETLPTTFAVSPNYPNPFNPTTMIRYQFPKAADVRLVVYNILGQKIRTLVNARIEPGYHQIQWDGRNEAGVQVSSGIYIYRFEAAGEFSQIRKMIFLK